MAVFAPFLANNKPLLISRGGAVVSPLLRDFFAPLESPEAALDRFFNLAAMTATMAGALGLPVWALHRLGWVRLTRRRIGVALFLLILAAIVPFLVVSPLLDKTDYRALAAQEPSGWQVWAPVAYGPFEQPSPPYEPPSSRHLMGTDKVGRDVLARLIHGSRVSLSVGFLSVGVAVAIGLVVGAVAAYYGGWVDLFVSRFIEIVICFPTFLLILTIVAFLDKRSIFNIMLIIGVTSWTGVARLVRGEVLRQKKMEYVDSARALGAGDGRIIARHLLPNSVAPVLVAATFGVAGAILTETGLSFLGFGVQMPMPSWGELLNQAKAWPDGYWWLTTWPGLMIFLTVTLYNLVGEGLRDALDPRLRV
jgi:peptide/nickel transport system permease protein